MSFKNDQEKQFIAGQNLFKGNPSLAFVHSDIALSMFQEAQIHEKESRPFLILTMTIYFFEQSIHNDNSKLEFENAKLEQFKDKVHDLWEKKHQQVLSDDLKKKIDSKIDTRKFKERKIYPYGANDIPDKYYLKAIIWYEDDFKPFVIKTLKQKAPESERFKIVDETGWIFLLHNVRYSMEFQSQQDLNKYARTEYGETIHASLKIPSVRYEGKGKSNNAIPKIKQDKSKDQEDQTSDSNSNSNSNSDQLSSLEDS